MAEEEDIFSEIEEDSENLEVRESTSQLEYTISGEVMRIVYSNDDGSYHVIRLLDQEGKEQTLVGALSGIMAGQNIEATGRWELHREHGRQFRVSSFHSILPSSPTGIRHYLSSKILPGIGKVYAKRIVDHFGADTIKILDNYSERLKEVPGIGAKRIKEIREAWKKTAAERETKIYLQGAGLTPSQCIKVIAKYGQGAAPEVVRRNPYKLATDIEGIGFVIADTIAAKIGIEPENPLRLCAGLAYSMEEIAASGHTCCPKEVLMLMAHKLLNVSEESLNKGFEIALSENKLLMETVDENGEQTVLLFLRRLRQAEIDLAHSITVLLKFPPPPKEVPEYKLGDEYTRLNTAQKQALKYSLKYGFSIVTGGPGVGKTTVVNQICAAAKFLHMQVLLAAPTGRAAKRLSEATGREAQTIHRLLKWDVQTRSFVHNQDKPLSCDMLVIDEVSMLDVQLASNLFCAIAPGTHVVMVGDKDQLPSVGPGAVLGDLISCGAIPVTYLTEIYRQADGSRIISNAHSVNNGRMPDLTPTPKGVKADFYWVDLDDPTRAAAMVVRLLCERIPQVFGFNPLTDVQVLTPMRKGECGTIALNSLLQDTLNPASEDKESFQFGTRSFRVGDKVMQISNNYDKGVFNGEMGLVSAVSNDTKTFTVLFDAGYVEYQQHESDQLQLAYAVTVHKSQGSEFPVVLMPILTQHYVMLQKNLVYTGMTRAKKLLIMIGSRRALGIAVGNDKPTHRRTMLARRIREAMA